jgi:catechol 2,3-dioxygenase-like lactoylglutathione lyase family enzyme
MKRFHMHLAVTDLEANVRFYSTLFGTEPTVRKPDYAKWMLDDPRVNFAISTRTARAGLDHVGIRAENEAELEDVCARLARADQTYVAQQDAACCYAKSNKYWIQDPQGVAREAYHTLGEIPVFGTSVGRNRFHRRWTPRVMRAPAAGETLRRGCVGFRMPGGGRAISGFRLARFERLQHPDDPLHLPGERLAPVFVPIRQETQSLV